MQTELLFTGRNCDRAGCDETFTPIGDASTPFLSTDMGGLYFCSETCKALQQAIFPSLQESLKNELEKLSVANPALVAHQLHSALTPSVSEIPTGDPHVRRFKITSHPFASLLTCLLCGDLNYQQHLGETGITQTLMRIGDFSCVISRIAPDALLREIARVKLRGQVPLGATVLITAKMLSSSRGLSKYLVQSQLEDGTKVSEPTTVSTYLAP